MLLNFSKRNGEIQFGFFMLDFYISVNNEMMKWKIRLTYSKHYRIKTDYAF